jgi:hypothetical protein
MAFPLPAVLINSVNVQTASGSMRMRSGRTITDAITQAAVIAAGGQLANPADPLIVAAVAIVLKLRGRGADEATCDLVMVAAASNQMQEEVAINFALNIGVTAVPVIEPAPMGKSGTFSSAGMTVTPPIVGGAGESAVLQLKKNGGNVAGATVTLNASAPANVAVLIPSTAGLAYLATDVFEMGVTYTAGTPNYTGVNAFADLVATGG